MTTPTPDGMTLKLERVAARVKGRALAAAMGVSPSRVGHIESSAFVSTEIAARYRQAIATCVEGRTSGTAA